MKFIHNIQENYSARLIISGGKGSNLYKLNHSGFNVPNGFIVNTKAFDEFINQNNLSLVIKNELSNVRVDNSDSISIASKNIKQEIKRAVIPVAIISQMKKILSTFESKKFSVRSSGVFEDNHNNSWAGQFDSFLEVDVNDIEENIKKCWASFFNSRAISYNIRAYKSLKKLKFAVVVQQMVESEISGVAFSIEPKENDFSKILIEATPGLGENLVSGKELAFTAILDKKKKILLNKSFDSNYHADLLSIKQINLLTEQILKLEKRFANPVDIEWAIAKDKLYFLQIRPITGLGRKSRLQKKVGSTPDINDYELTFKVSGLSFLFTDMLAHGFKYLDPLFTSDQEGQFCQYFTNEKMEYATKYGMNVFSRQNGFKEYQTNFTKFYEKNIKVLDEIIQERKLSKSSTNQFFTILSKFFTYYSKMDNQFTNLAYIYSEERPVVKENLRQLSLFKDNARLWINNTSLENESRFSKFIDWVCQEFKIERSDFECYKVSDIIQLFHGSFVSDKEIQNRKLSFTIYCSASEQFYITGNKSLDYINKISARQSMFLSSEIKGQVANKVQKVVKGKVRVINIDYGNLDLLNNQINEMVNGEILVAEFTAPELISACRKAKAIVTDIGGLLSHAAIVSRELNIPCLVGTHNAAKFLKTGDEVTIDFELGTVNKI